MVASDTGVSSTPLNMLECKAAYFCKFLTSCVTSPTLRLRWDLYLWHRKAHALSSRRMGFIPLRCVSYAAVIWLQRFPVFCIGTHRAGETRLPIWGVAPAPVYDTPGLQVSMSRVGLGVPTAKPLTPVRPATSSIGNSNTDGREVFDNVGGRPWGALNRF